MAMGIVSSDIFESEIIAIGSRNSEPQVIDINRGRGKVNSVPEGLRKIAAEESISGTSVDEIAKVFGISKSSISAYKKGANSTASYHNPDENLKNHVDSIKDDIASSARDKIVEALKCINEDGLKNEKLRDVSGIAKDMAVVMEKMEGNNKIIDKQVNQVIIYAPRMKEEDDYQVIEAAY